jgi:hypothetical protein
MELILGIIVGAILVIAGLKLKNKIENLEKKIYKLEKLRHEDYVAAANLAMDIVELKASNFPNKKLEDRIKMLEEELKFEKKSNGMNLQKVFKDIVKLREHLTYIQNK